MTRPGGPVDTRSDDARGSDRFGFTLVELLLVLGIAGVMAALAAPRVTQAIAAQAVVQGRDGLVWLAATARASALERGEPVALVVDAGLDAVRIVVVSTDSTLETRSFTDDQVDVVIDGGTQVRVCYTARGWALHTSCSTGLPATVRFQRGGQETVAQIRPLGQVVR